PFLTLSVLLRPATLPPFPYTTLFRSFGYSGYKLAVVFAAMALLAAVWALMTRTRAGLIMRATQYDRETAQAFGIDTDRVYAGVLDRKSTRLNSSHVKISYAVFCLKKQ